MANDIVQDAKKNKYLEGIIERFEDDKVVIKTADNQEILWPKKNLPVKYKTGTQIRIVLTTEKEQKEDKEKLAKEILNQLLKKTD